MKSAPRYQSLNHFTGKVHPMPTQNDRQPRDLEAARRAVAKLDQYPGNNPLRLADRLDTVAAWITKAIDPYRPPRSLTVEQLAMILIAWQASPLLIEQHAHNLLDRVHSASFKAGV